MDAKQNETQTARQRNWGDAPLDDKQDESELKWYHIRCQWVKLTADYVGGLLAGFGLGIGLMAAIVRLPLISVLGGAITLIGVSIAYNAQRERDMREDFQKKRDESSITR